MHVCLEIGKKNLKCKTWENGVLEQNHGLSENVDLLPAASGGVVLVRA